jgi:putative flippase GtrA
MSATVSDGHRQVRGNARSDVPGGMHGRVIVFPLPMPLVHILKSSCALLLHATAISPQMISVFSSTFIKQSSFTLRFLISGGISTPLHWATMAMLFNMGAHASTATAAGGAMGGLANLLLQREFTFHSSAHRRELVPFYVVAVLVGWMANILVFSVLHGGARLPVPLAQCITSLFVAFLNFWLFKRILLS